MNAKDISALRAEQRRLKAEWDAAFGDLCAAGVAYDADHPVARAYRAASDAVNHVNRKLDFVNAIEGGE